MELTSLQIIPDQPGNLTFLSMAVSCQLGIKQFIIDRKLKAPPIRRHQGDRFHLRLKFLQQFGCQTDSTVGVASNRTINQVDLQ